MTDDALPTLSIAPEELDARLQEAVQAHRANGHEQPEAAAMLELAPFTAGYQTNDLLNACRSLSTVAMLMLTSERFHSEILAMEKPPAFSSIAHWSKVLKGAVMRLKTLKAERAAMMMAEARNGAANKPLWDLLELKEDEETGAVSIDWGTGSTAFNNALIIFRHLPCWQSMTYDVRRDQLSMRMADGSAISIDPQSNVTPCWLIDHIVSSFGREYVPPGMATVNGAWRSVIDEASRVLYTSIRNGEAYTGFIRIVDHLMDRIVSVLPVWDGVERIPTMWQHIFPGQSLLGGDEYLAVVARQTMLGFATRLIGPRGVFLERPELMLSQTVDYQTVTYINGDPGTGKSMLWSLLFGASGDCISEAVVGKNINLSGDKDNLQSVHAHAVCVCDEFADLIYRRKDASSIKAFVTADSDEWRNPYATVSLTRPRRFILVGTGNLQEVVSADDTYRRYLPIGFVRQPDTGRAMDDRWVRENRMQLMAEAFAKVKAGVSVVLSRQEEDLVVKLVSSSHRVYSDAELELLEAMRLWVNGRLPTGCFLTPSRLPLGHDFRFADMTTLVKAVGGDLWKHKKTMADAYRKLFGERRRCTRTGQTVYCLPEDEHKELIDTPEPTTVTGPVEPPATFAMAAN